jgi:hypothetical protein
MPTQARSAHGMALRLGDGVPPATITITGATNATPIIVLTSTAHGIVDVSYGTVSGVGGNLGANGSWIVRRVDATHLELCGSAGTGAYTSGGTLVRTSAYATVAEVRNLNDAGFAIELVDVSAHDGAGWSVSIPILKRGKALRVDLNMVPADPTHDNVTGALALALATTKRPWMLVYPTVPRAAAYWEGWVSDHGTNFPIGPLQGSIVIAIDGQMRWAP